MPPGRLQVEDVFLQPVFGCGPGRGPSPDHTSTQSSSDSGNPVRGNRVLEVGCGQGSTTCVLACAVGPDGFVHGIDNAPMDYGRPLTMSQAQQFFANSPMRERIRMDIGVDILSPDTVFPEASFDWVVLSMCSWYFESVDQLARVLAKTRTFAKHLAFAEWDVHPTSLRQLPHYTAVILRSQFEAMKSHSEANLRTLITPADAKEAARRAGWTIEREASVHTPELKDAQWEIEFTLADIETEMSSLQGVTEQWMDLITSQRRLLEEMAHDDYECLPAFTFVGRS